MSDERGTKRRTTDSEQDHAEQRPEKSAATGSALRSSEQTSSSGQPPVKTSDSARMQVDEQLSQHLIAGQRAVDTIIQRLSTGTPRAAIESFVSFHPPS